MSPIVNEFILKKLGEVLAFSRAGIEIFKKGDVALTTVLYDDVLTSINSFEAHTSEIEKITKAVNGEEIVTTKAAKTTAKLLSMAETYIGDEWDNPAELLEWLGFFEGAAIVHWKLVEGAAKEMKHEELIALAESGVSLHSMLLEKTKTAIATYAQNKVK